MLWKACWVKYRSRCASRRICIQQKSPRPSRFLLHVWQLVRNHPFAYSMPNKNPVWWSKDLLPVFSSPLGVLNGPGNTLFLNVTLYQWLSYCQSTSQTAAPSLLFRTETETCWLRPLLSCCSVSEAVDSQKFIFWFCWVWGLWDLFLSQLPPVSKSLLIV